MPRHRAQAIQIRCLVHGAVPLGKRPVYNRKRFLVMGNIVAKTGDPPPPYTMRASSLPIDAARLLEDVLTTQQPMLAEDHHDLLESQHELAIAYLASRQIENAVQLLEKVVAIEERVLAKDHFDRLASQQTLASAYNANGQVKGAVRLLKHMVVIRKRKLEEDHL